MRTSIWLVRHGQTVSNKARRFQGPAGSPLTPYGLAQAAALAERIKRQPFTRVFASEAACARSTADMLVQGRAVPCAEDACWNEQACGGWEGLRYREVLRRFPGDVAARNADPRNAHAEGGESLAAVAERVAAGWRALLAGCAGERVLLVSHALPIQLVLCHLAGQPPMQHWTWRVDTGSLTVIDVYGAAAITRVVNEVPRLRGAAN